MEIVRRGCMRIVFLVGPYAIKIPTNDTWRLFLRGLLGNMQEVTFSLCGWEELCPVVFSVRGGWLIVMPRCRPLTRDEWFSLDFKNFREKEDRCIPVEEKMDSFGVLDGRIVAVDYGS